MRGQRCRHEGGEDSLYRILRARVGPAILASLFASVANAFAQIPAAPRAADGYPDLEGIWTSRWSTPLERGPDTRSLIATPAEAAKLHSAGSERLLAGNPGAQQNGQDLESLATIRGEARAYLIVDPPDGRLPYTEEGRTRRAGFVINTGADGPEQRWFNERCVGSGLGRGAAPLLVLPVGNIRQIVQTPGSVVVYTEAFNQLRIIPLGGRTANTLFGATSTGRYERETLVVETTGFYPDDQFRRSAFAVFPISPSTRITERYTRTGAGEILYTFTVEDATLYKRAWTAETALKKSDERMYEFACHEGNYSMAGILGAARIVEKQKAAMPNAERRQ
jgi:hypothetical protein